MAYVVVVFAIINAAAILGVAFFFWGIAQDYPKMVQTAIQDEVRKQDDRIEKRLARVQGVQTDPDGNLTDPAVLAGVSAVRAGVRVRRDGASH